MRRYVQVDDRSCAHGRQASRTFIRESGSQFGSQFTTVRSRARAVGGQDSAEAAGHLIARELITGDLKSGRSAVRSRPWPPAIPGPPALAVSERGAEGLNWCSMRTQISQSVAVLTAYRQVDSALGLGFIHGDATPATPCGTANASASEIGTRSPAGRASSISQNTPGCALRTVRRGTTSVHSRLRLGRYFLARRHSQPHSRCVGRGRRCARRRLLGGLRVRSAR